MKNFLPSVGPDMCYVSVYKCTVSPQMCEFWGKKFVVVMPEVSNMYWVGTLNETGRVEKFGNREG